VSIGKGNPNPDGKKLAGEGVIIFFDLYAINLEIRQ